MIARSNSNTPVTVIPISLNGSKRSQTIGYTISAKSASGQQTTRSKHHIKKVSIAAPFPATLPDTHFLAAMFH
ncbi:MAG TPA: hypothetical protein VK832_19830, partial [Burkholderiaceae bacterium]|nr:hypothetical protein [Burkholderiaceae bacterium]